jgi:Zn-dependent protease/predicted transcriptional regulator
LILVVFLVALNLGMGLLPAWHPEWSPSLRWAVSLVASLLFIGSIAVHELAHALVARAHDLPVRRITLFLFGGMAHLEHEPESPRAEFWMAIVGPATSIILGLLCVWVGSFLLPNPDALASTPLSVMEHASPLTTILLWLGPLNILLGVFNMLPGFPLDGGRVLRAVLWWGTGDLRQATLIASRAGQAFAWFLMGLGVFMMLGRSVPFFGSGFGSGVWLLLIGWFLNNAARASYQQLMIQQALEDVPVRDVMRSEVRSVSPEDTLGDLMRDQMVWSDQHAFPVVRDGQLLGLVKPEQVASVPRDLWSAVRVSEIMTPVQDLRVLGPDDHATEALQQLAEQDPIPVVDHAKLIGVARRDDLMRWLAWHVPHAAGSSPAYGT